MKRIFCILLLAQFLFFSISHAEGQKELTFRNIPWGTSINMINNPSSVYSYESKMPLEESFMTIPQWRMGEAMTKFKSGFTGSSYGAAAIKVGGFPLTSINYYCMFGVKDGILQKDEASSEFYAADYVFNVLDHKTAYYSLQSSLNELYGEGRVTEEVADSYYLAEGVKTIIPQIDSRTEWTGANDTHILLFASWIVDEDKVSESLPGLSLDIYKSLYMTYYKGGMDDKLNEISHLEEQLEREQELENAGGFEGL